MSCLSRLSLPCTDTAPSVAGRSPMEGLGSSGKRAGVAEAPAGLASVAGEGLKTTVFI